jgi:hypothetical protein
MLFTALLENFQHRLAPFIVKYTNAVLDDTFGSFEKQKLLLRESCYNALGWGSYYLYDLINFKQWYSTMLTKEIEMRDDRYRLIRRRACWLLGRWVEKIETEEMRTQIYSNILTLLQEKDIVLRLSALLTLKPRMSILNSLLTLLIVLEDDVNFSIELFAPFLDQIMTHTIQSLLSVKEEETKLTLLSLLSIIIERMGKMVSIRIIYTHKVKIVPYTGTIMKYLPPIWNQSQDAVLMKNAIIKNMTKLIEVTPLSNIVLML